MTKPLLVQGDTRPTVVAQLHDSANATSYVDLTGCTVFFQMRKADDRLYTVNASASVIDAANGKVSYQFGPNDLNVPGDYVVQWEVHYTDGGIQTTATPVPVTVRRQ